MALLLAMAACRAEQGIVVSAVHVHHGLRGAEADGDALSLLPISRSSSKCRCAWNAGTLPCWRRRVAEGN